MTTALILLITFVSMALVISFMCSIAEAVLLSITPAYIENLRNHKPIRAKLLEELRLEKVDRSLAAILTMNTIAHTVGAIQAGAQSAIVFGNQWVGVFSAIITLMILFFSEIIPKTLGAVYWPKLAWITIRFIRFSITALYPLVLVSEWLTRIIAKDSSLNSFNRDEFIAMAVLGIKTGDFDKQESMILSNLFRFSSLKAVDIMTPRTVISGLALNTEIEAARKIVSNTPFSRWPVFDGNLDNIKGFILKSDILLQEKGNGGTVKDFLRKLKPVPDNLSLPKLFNLLLSQNLHVAYVVDEFGATSGIVSLEDVIETLIGMEIMDEKDKFEDMQELARKKWKERMQSQGIDI